MPRWLRRETNATGEWTVVDLQRGYRICAYHVHHHGGVHIHVPENGPVVATVDIPDARQAERIVRAYARNHRSFHLASFLKEVTRWRSASSNG